MTPIEVVALVALVVKLTPMALEEDTSEVWELIVADELEDFDEAKAAVVSLRKRQKWIDPSEVVQEAKALRKKRLEAAGLVGANAGAALPAGRDGRPINPDDTVAYAAALRAGRLAVATDARPRKTAVEAFLASTQKALPAIPRPLPSDYQAGVKKVRSAIPVRRPVERKLSYGEAMAEADQILADQAAVAAEQEQTAEQVSEPAPE